MIECLREASQRNAEGRTDGCGHKEQAILFGDHGIYQRDAG